MPVFMKNGTAVGSQSRCVRCAHSHILQGYRESEEVTYCNYATLMVVPFKVRDCSNFEDRARPTWEQMNDLAIEIRPTPTLKSAGFCNGDGPKRDVTVATITDTR
jgi:hypothetical protein